MGGCLTGWGPALRAPHYCDLRIPYGISPTTLLACFPITILILTRAATFPSYRQTGKPANRQTGKSVQGASLEVYLYGASVVSWKPGTVVTSFVFFKKSNPFDEHL